MKRIEIKQKTDTTWRTPTYQECQYTFFVQPAPLGDSTGKDPHYKRMILKYTSFGSLHDARRCSHSWVRASGLDGTPKYKIRIV